jgi:histidine decarboxylase
MHGMYMGRTLLKARTGRLPKAYFTREAHYSVQILRDLLGLETVKVGTLADGGMDPEDLARKLKENADSPALVVATVGTTFIGAVDRLDRLRETLPRDTSYVHLDAALFGGYLPFTRHAHEVVYRVDEGDIRGRYDSLAVSCHKFFGFPSPAGLFITTRSLYDEFNAFFSRIHDPEYIHHVPGTITCSRDAVKPAEFYYFTTSAARERQAQDAESMLENATYLLDQMNTHFPQISATRSNPMSNTVYFRSPGEELIEKYSLATEHREVDGRSQRFAHVVVMPHVSKSVLDEFLAEIQHSQS